MIYTYKCTKCKQFTDKEVDPKGHISKTITCPHCRGKAMKVISLPAVHYRGEGFTKAVKQ